MVVGINSIPTQDPRPPLIEDSLTPFWPCQTLRLKSSSTTTPEKSKMRTTGSTGPQLGAAYSSFLGRRFAAGEKKLIGQINLGSASVVQTALGKAAIFHESVHALMDVKGIKPPTMQDDEVVAYLADALYLKANHTNVSGGTLEMAIYKAAFAMVD